MKLSPITLVLSAVAGGNAAGSVCSILAIPTSFDHQNVSLEGTIAILKETNPAFPLGDEINNPSKPCFKSSSPQNNHLTSGAPRPVLKSTYPITVHPYSFNLAISI